MMCSITLNAVIVVFLWGLAGIYTATDCVGPIYESGGNT
jgi:hypothetical protein